MLIGAPKSLEELQTFSKPELEELFKGTEAYVTSGVPMEVPAAIPIGQFGRIVITLKRYHALMEQIAYAEAGMETPGMDQIIEKWDALQEAARELVESRPPPPASRIIVPK